MTALVQQVGISVRLALPLYTRSPTLLSPQIHCCHDMADSDLKVDPAICENLRYFALVFF